MSIDGRRAAFTLIEMLAVVAIVAILIALTLGSYSSWGRSAGMRVAAANLRSSLNLARQWAVTHQVRTSFTCGNAGSPLRGFYVISDATWGDIGRTNYLAVGVVFPNGWTRTLQFRPDGSCEALNNAFDLVVVELGKETNGLSTRIRVIPATGMAEEEQ
jgi:prepilin-type N-terminal cleavage/methylation domain-containing protein